MSTQDLSNPSLRNDSALAIDQKTIDGVDKYFAKTPTLNINGEARTPADIKADFQADIDASKALDAARAQQKGLVAKKKAARARARATRKGLKAYLQGNYGGELLLQMLQDMGFPLPKGSGKKTVEAKAHAIAQTKATREARHTMGRRQRERIKGVVAPQAPAPGALPPKSGS
jgi:hypothetical protein